MLSKEELIVVLLAADVRLREAENRLDCISDRYWTETEKLWPECGDPYDDQSDQLKLTHELSVAYKDAYQLCQRRLTRRNRLITFLDELYPSDSNDDLTASESKSN